MRRRAFLAGTASAALASTAGAQALSTIYRIGRLSPLSGATERPMIDALRQGLAEHGWIEGRNIALEMRFAEGRLDRLPALAAELVRVPVNVIVSGSNPGARAAKAATSTIPIVMVTTGDPVADGLIDSLARPGGNITGVTALAQDLSAKRLELLKEALTGVSRIASLIDPASPYTAPNLKALEMASAALGLQLLTVPVRTPGEIEQAFASMRDAQAGALMVATDVMFITHRQRIVALAAKHRLPTMYGERTFVQEGGLLFYGASLPGLYRRAAVYVDRILKGAKPADLPVEQPSTFELVVNLKAAKALGLNLSPNFLDRADEVIE